MNIQLKRIRKQRNVTQKQLANDIGATVRQVGYWEKGNLSLEDACTLADYFNITLDELAGREWPQSPALSADERQLVDSYRLMDPEQRGKFSDLAGTFVVASEKDAPERVRDVERAGRDVVR